MKPLSQVLDEIDNPNVHENLDSPLIKFLISLYSIMPTRRDLDYNSREHWLLVNGQFFTNNTHDYNLGEIKQCFANSQQLALDNRELLYCEGYSSSIIPIHHGWCLDPLNQEVIDITLRDQKNVEYFGAVFNTEYVLEEILKYEEYHSLLDNYRDHFSLLRDDSLLDIALHPDWRID